MTLAGGLYRCQSSQSLGLWSAAVPVLQLSQSLGLWSAAWSLGTLLFCLLSWPPSFPFPVSVSLFPFDVFSLSRKKLFGVGGVEEIGFGIVGGVPGVVGVGISLGVRGDRILFGAFGFFNTSSDTQYKV